MSFSSPADALFAVVGSARAVIFSSPKDAHFAVVGCARAVIFSLPAGLVAAVLVASVNAGAVVRHLVRHR